MFHELKKTFFELKNKIILLHRPLSFRSSFLLLGIIYLIAISSLLRSNFNYIDDMGRIMRGYTGWEETFSRYGSTYLSYFVHAGDYLTDISPLPQLLAVMIMCLASLIIIHIITGKKEFTVFQLIAALPIGLTPYFLECLSYKFDAPYMAISVLFSILPLLFYSKGYAIYGIASAIGTLLMYITYQASSGIFPLLVTLMAFIFWTQKKEYLDIVKFILVSIIGYAFGLGVFRLLLVKNTTVDGSNYISASIAAPTQIFNNYKHYARLFLQDFKLFWIVLIIIISFLFFCVCIFNSQKTWWCTLILSAAAFFCMAVFSLGVYPAMNNPLTSPRTMYGIGIFIGCISIYVVSAKDYLPCNIPGIFSTFLLSWCFIVFALTYGNALYMQANYTDFRIQKSIEDLEDLGYLSTDETKSVQLKGTIGYAPALRGIPHDSNILYRLVPVTYRGSWYWGLEGIKSFYNLSGFNFDKNADFDSYDLPVLSDNLYETIYGDKEHIIIELKE